MASGLKPGATPSAGNPPFLLRQGIGGLRLRMPRKRRPCLQRGTGSGASCRGPEARSASRRNAARNLGLPDHHIVYIPTCSHRVVGVGEEEELDDDRLIAHCGGEDESERGPVGSDAREDLVEDEERVA